MTKDTSTSTSPLVEADRRAQSSFDDRTVGATAECPTQEQATASASTHWIEIELIGEDDAPVVGERYRVTLADASVIEGRIGKTGVVRIEGVDPGQCTVTFPELDREAWDSA